MGGNMKMIMVVCPENRREEIRALIGAHGVHAYTELRDVYGAGATEPRMGTRAWPGTSALVFTVTPEEKKEELFAALRECSARLPPAEGLRAFVLPVEEML
jgi:hypothetical protein